MDREVSTPGALIAAVVCTYNRATLMARALDSLARQNLPPGTFEIILVDDGSPDHTRQIAEDFARRPLRFRAIHQSNAGLGVARNVGWRAASAPLIAFLDDDAVAPPDWLEKILTTFAIADAKVAVLGGPVDPEWEIPPPTWLTANLGIWLTVFDLGPDALSASDRALFAGANMAFRTDALRDVDGFAENLGRRGSSLLSHEESGIWLTLSTRGWRNAYRPDLRVRHFVAAARLQRNWFRRRLFWEGVSVARQASLWAPGMKFPRRLIRWIGIARARFVSGVFLHTLFRPWRWTQDVTWQTNACYHAGFLWEALQTIGQSHRER